MEEENNKLKAAIYLRCSTVKQSHNVEVQRLECLNEIKRKNMIYIGEYVDYGINEAREGLFKLYEDANKKLFDVIIVYQLNRFGRSRENIINIIEYFTNIRVKIISCSEKIDTFDSKNLRMFSNIIEHQNITNEKLMTKIFT